MAPAAQPAATPTVVKLDVPGPVDDVARTIEPAAGNRILEHVWILHDGQTLRVDPDANRVTATVSGYRPRADRPVVRLTATAAGGLVATVVGGGLLVIAPQTARVVAAEPVDTRARVAGTVDLDVFAVCCGGDTPPNAGRAVPVRSWRIISTVPSAALGTPVAAPACTVRAAASASRVALAAGGGGRPGRAG